MDPPTIGERGVDSRPDDPDSDATPEGDAVVESESVDPANALDASGTAAQAGAVDTDRVTAG